MIVPIKIEVAAYTKYDNATFTQFQNKMYQTIRNFGIDLSKLNISEDWMTEWNRYIQLMIDINNSVLASARTPEMKAIDEKRSMYVGNLFTTVQNGMSSPDETIQKAAANLIVVVDAYKGLKRERMDRKTVLINGLIYDLMAEKYAMDLNTLGLGKVIEALDSTNNAYDGLRNQRTVTRAEEKLPPSKEVRTQTGNCYNTICMLIESSYLIAATEEERTKIAGLIDTLNQYISEIKANYNQSKAKRAEENGANQTPAEGN